MFSSSYCIPLLLYVLKATLAATLPAAPLQSPNNSTQSSNTNITQEQQESLQLLYSNETLPRYVKMLKPALGLSGCSISDDGAATMSRTLRLYSPSPMMNTTLRSGLSAHNSRENHSLASIDRQPRTWKRK